MVQASRTFDAGAFSLTSLQQRIDELPADDRARLAWAPTELRAAVDAFLASARADADVAALSRAYVTRFLPMLHESLVGHLGNDELLQPILEHSAQADFELLKHRAAPGGADIAEWVLRASNALLSALATLRGIPSAEELDAIRESATKQPPGPIVGMRVLMLAATEAARRNESGEQISSLIFRAFDIQRAVIAQLAAAGTEIKPFRGETPAQRVERLERYAQNVRDLTTEDDWAVIEGALSP